MASPDEWFCENLEKFFAGTLEKFKVFDLGLTPDLGIKRFPKAQVIMTQAVLRKVVEVKHLISIDHLKPLPSLLQRPRRVFRSKSDEDTAIFQLPLAVDSQPLVLVAKYGRHPDFGVIYLVKSIHRRPFVQLKAWMDLGLMLYSEVK